MLMISLANYDETTLFVIITCISNCNGEICMIKLNFYSRYHGINSHIFCFLKTNIGSIAHVNIRILFLGG